jgi:hypothetical protein
VQTREGNHVDCEFPEIGIELTRESQARGDTRHDRGDEVVQVTIRGIRQLEGAHADVIESLDMSVQVEV